MKNLYKHKHTTEDTRGCQFSYTCYTRKDRWLNQETWEYEDDIERLYVCKEFPKITATSLKELKVKMGKLNT